MNVKVGGTTLAILLTAALIALGVSECQRGPLNPELADDISAEQKTWLTIEHRIKRSAPALVEISHAQQALGMFYRADAANQEKAWTAQLLDSVADGLAALNNAPGGKQYRQVTVKARILGETDDVELVYDMAGFDAIKTQQGGYSTFANQPQSLGLSAQARAQAESFCGDLNGSGFYREFCKQLDSARLLPP